MFLSVAVVASITGDIGRIEPTTENLFNIFAAEEVVVIVIVGFVLFFG